MNKTRLVLASAFFCATALVLSCGNERPEPAAGKSGSAYDSSFAAAQNSWRAVSVGLYHACAVNNDRTLWCWGLNTYGELGDGTSADRLSPVKEVNGSTTWDTVSTGLYHTCARKKNGQVWCFGLNNHGQLGDGTSADKKIPTREISGALDWASVSAGAYHTCGRNSDKTIWCWGMNSAGALGDGTTHDKKSARQESTKSTNWNSVAVGYHTCGVNSNGVPGGGELFCWGENNCGQLGLGNTLDKTVPTKVGINYDWADVVAGFNHTCARRTARQLYCWGLNNFGQLGDGDFNNLLQPSAPVSSIIGWTSVSVGVNTTCAKDLAGLLSCWGDNEWGQFGTGKAYWGKNAPVQSSTKNLWQTVSLGDQAVCGLKADQSMLCWGGNFYGQLGNGSIGGNLAAPERIGTATNWLAASAGSDHTCALKKNGSLYCWGYNYYGELGTGNNSYKDKPARVGKKLYWRSLDSGDFFSCALKANHSLWCWGKNNRGQLGDGTTAARKQPVRESGKSLAWQSVSSGGEHSCGLQAGAAWCWGNNGVGQLGDGSTALIRLSPVAVIGGGTWTQVAAGGFHSCGLKAGAIWCWGWNGYGQLGDGTTANKNIPAREATAATDWIAVSCAAKHTCAIKSTGTLWCWGLNTDGRLGDNTNSNSALPVQEFTHAADWLTVVGADAHTCALKSDHTLWCWGNNAYGQLGSGDFISVNIPTRESSLATTWANATGAFKHTCAVRTDGTLWCWGGNLYGNLGDNRAWTGKPKPVSLP